LQQFQPCGNHFGRGQRQSGDVTAGLPQTLDHAQGDRIVDADQNDRNGRACALGRERGRRPGGDEDRDTGADQFLDDGGQRLGAILRPAVENSNVAAVGPAERGEVLAKRIEKALVLLPGARMDKADARDLDLSCDRAPGRCHDAGEQHRQSRRQRDEFLRGGDLHPPTVSRSAFCRKPGLDPAPPPMAPSGSIYPFNRPRFGRRFGQCSVF
jgi:hypothetical protein